MIKNVLEIIGFIGIVIMFLFVICACILSGKISEEERKNDRKSK